VPLVAQVQRLYGAAMPEYKTAGAVGFDIAANERVVINYHEVVRVPTGLVVKPPAGYWWAMFNRSSNYKHGFMLANNVGIIDPDYCGPEDECAVPLYNFSDRQVVVERYARIAQGIFFPVAVAQFVEAFEMTGPSRGGWGSTGR
jgi:dUTP pyrophosphatase